MSKEYYTHSFNEVLNDHNIDPSYRLIDDLLSVVDMAYEYSGVSNQIKGSEESEINKLKKEIQRLKDKHSDDFREIRTNYANSSNLSLDQVIIENNKILIETTYG